MPKEPDWLDRVNAAIDEHKVNDGMLVELLLAFCGTLSNAGKEGLVRYMERECKILAPSDPWKNNEVQFARLLSEMVAALDESTLKHVITDCARSMDLSTDQVNELFDRAEKVFEIKKENT